MFFDKDGEVRADLDPIETIAKLSWHNDDDYGYFCDDYIESRINKYFKNTPISQFTLTSRQDSQNDMCSITDIGKFKVQEKKIATDVQ